ncbi:hypothetical protein JAO71_13050 [Olleya sp. YSTF-M6]|uniref:Uncharacterized protein n=1 Tax=Olleya sediminilitoris TaxID=2795739 RepID=A0ABS1WNM3_9FLAO|nr:hypothetical protein [Olleya sediminilitoris]MBL7560729.1 hypothetical protein [Olleya sediminilitoris]
MNFKQLITLLFLSLVIFNCSDDNSDNTDNNEVAFTGNFFPLHLDNSWTYLVTDLNNNTNETTVNTDLLMVESESNTGYNLTVNQGDLANGIMSGILTSGELSLTETTLTSNGSIQLPIEGFDFEIEIDNALLYNTSAENETELSSQSGTFTQDIEGYPVTINYTLSSQQLQNLESYVVNTIDYQTVTSAKIALNLSASITVTQFGISQSLPIVDSQEVLSIVSHYAKDIGLIQAEANISFSLNATILALLQQSGMDLSTLPTSLSATNTQILTDFNITE